MREFDGQVAVVTGGARGIGAEIARRLARGGATVVCADVLDTRDIVDEINGTGYGLTLGVHSRIERTQRYIANRVMAGNCYINRNMIGAVVGVQPFGGERLSGTGPKAGGPHYMLRFATERTLTVNTAAVGGNASLLELED